MKIEKIKGKNPLADLFAAPLSAEGEADLHQLQIADVLAEFMEEQGISKVELARRMGIKPSRVTAILSGSGNFTFLTAVRAARAVGAKFHHCLAPVSHKVRWNSWDESTSSEFLCIVASDQKKSPTVSMTLTESNDESLPAAA
jgi:transcriptional regulator with XRE-family HTH domain